MIFLIFLDLCSTETQRKTTEWRFKKMPKILNLKAYFLNFSSEYQELDQDVFYTFRIDFCALLHLDYTMVLVFWVFMWSCSTYSSIFTVGPEFPFVPFLWKVEKTQGFCMYYFLNFETSDLRLHINHFNTIYFWWKCLQINRGFLVL